MRRSDKLLGEAASRFQGDLHALREFIEFFEKVIEKKGKRASQPRLSKAAKKDIAGLMTLLRSAIATPPTKTIKYVITSPGAKSLLMSTVVQVKQRSLLAEMAVIYLIAQLEGYLKDLLRAVFLISPQSLKSKRQVTYEEILRHESLDDLKKGLAQREVDQLGRGSIENVDEYFRDKLNVALSSYSKWKIIREAAYRRHLLVHNSGVTNAAYCRATGHMKEGQNCPQI
jgi:hypothetical protein